MTAYAIFKNSHRPIEMILLNDLYECMIGVVIENSFTFEFPTVKRSTQRN